MAATRMSAAVAASLEVIQAGVSYPLPVFARISRLGKHALRTARRKGLKVRYVGNVGFVNGSDWLDYLDQHGDDEHRAAASA